MRAIEFLALGSLISWIVTGFLIYVLWMVDVNVSDFLKIWITAVFLILGIVCTIGTVMCIRKHDKAKNNETEN